MKQESKRFIGLERSLVSVLYPSLSKPTDKCVMIRHLPS